MNGFRRNTFSVVGLVLILVAGSGCSVFTDSEPDQLQKDLNQNREAWESLGLQNYQLIQRKTCFCGPPANRFTRLEIRDGELVAATDVETGEPVPEDRRIEFRSVGTLFDLIQDAIDRNAASLIVGYHRELGYPTEVFIDYQANVADEELGYEITQLTTFQ